ncbi:MAG: hydrogenase large subunit, partial [Trebonia sp.]|nr:hydrogenase large subunit [Trebonia sp.]
YMFDHNLFQENLVGVDFCERMVAETNPGVLELANRTESPHAAEHGYKTIGDIMRSLNPLEGEFYREALQVSRSTREMFCLMEGRHVHPSTLYPGGVGTVATVQLFTDYLTRLMRYVEFMKRVVPMHDDLFDFFYEALPGYEEVGRRRVLLGCWGSLNNPEYCDFTYRNMADWGRKMFVTPGVVVDGKLVTTSLVDINLGIRILLGHSFYEDWEDKEMFVTHDELGNPVDRRHPWNQHTIPRPGKRDFDDKYSWTMSPRWFDGKLVTTSLVDINLGIRILLGHSYYEDWEDQEMFVTHDELGNPVDRRHPWNQHTIPRPAKRDFDDKYSWTMSPRWFDGKDHLPLDTGGGPIARLWSTALAGLVDFNYVKSTGHSVLINLPRTVSKPETTFEWKIPVDKQGKPLSNAIERDRARTYFQAYAAACALHFVEQALAEIRAGRTKTWESFNVPEEGYSCGFTEAVRGVLSHHMVIKGGKIANYHPYPPTPWNGSVRDTYGTPGPYEDAVQNTPIFEENTPENFKGIDIMRAVRSFDPCLPCGVHMYLGNGKVLNTAHSPAGVPLAT